MLDSREYANRLNSLQRRLHTLVRLVLKRAEVDDVHDMRTALRRLQTMIALLPQGKRRSAYVKSLKELSIGSRELWVIDVIALRLNAYSGKNLVRIRSGLSMRREEALVQMRQQLEKYTEHEILFKPGKRKTLGVGETHERSVRKAERKLSELLSSISGEAVNMEELHEFR